MIQVQLGAPEGALEIIGVRGIPVQLLIDGDALDIVELEARAHAIEEVGILRRGEAGDLGG